MSVASKLFAIWAVNKTFSTTTPMFMRLLAGMAAIIICALAAAIIVVLLIIGGVWLGYTQMISGGMDHQSAALIVGSLLLALLASIMLTARDYSFRLHSASKKIMNFQPALGGKVSRAVDAFMEGFDSDRPLR